MLKSSAGENGVSSGPLARYDKLTYKKNPIKLMFPYLLGTEFKDNIIE